MNRRQIIQRLSFLLGSIPWATSWAQSEFSPPVAAEGLILTWLNHSCVLFQGGSFRILVNPFRSLGCTAGYPPPKVEVDLVLLSSRLFDEGGLDVVPGDPRVLFQSGAYQVEGITLQGVSMAHDDLTPKGQRFGTNVGWRWQQMGIDIVHLGGAAAPITREQEILLAKPDLLLIPVGGGPKNYDAPEARAAIETLQPKLVIPTMYRTEAAGPECELSSLNDFLELFPPASIQKAPANTVVLFPNNFPTQGTGILSFGETFAPPSTEKPSITFTPAAQN
jgi:L-ascorbate metabolism protein UlaG (beta-lactamase superfamily)